MAAEARAAPDRASTNGFDDADASEVVNVHIPPIHGELRGLPGLHRGPDRSEPVRRSSRASSAGPQWPVGRLRRRDERPGPDVPVLDARARTRRRARRSTSPAAGVVEAYAQHPVELERLRLRRRSGLGFSRTGGSTHRRHRRRRDLPIRRRDPGRRAAATMTVRGRRELVRAARPARRPCSAGQAGARRPRRWSARRGPHQPRISRQLPRRDAGLEGAVRNGAAKLATLGQGGSPGEPERGSCTQGSIPAASR